MRLVVLTALLGVAASAQQPARQPPADDPINEVVQRYLWPAPDAGFPAAQSAVSADASLKDMTRERFHDLEEAMRRGRRTYPEPPAKVDGRYPVAELLIDVPAGPAVPVIVQLPGCYDPAADWPLMFAMHGGPPGTVAQARSGAERMLRVWKDAADRAGWIVAAPALTPSVTAGGRTEERLPYELFHPEQAQAVIAALRARFRINPDRMVSTGISLGSNYSIAFATSNPHMFSAIVPVSTEGDSRELLLRNLKTVPVYILEGTQDKNIRGIGGPRAFRDIVASFGYDLTYREFGDRAHEGFQEHYGDVLRWLETRARQAYPRSVIRVPTTAITPINRRVHWIEADTRQAFVRATVTSASRLDITARWARTLNVFLHDRLVNLDQPIEVWVNGVKAFSGKVPRSGVTALQNARLRGDERLIDAARIEVAVPTTAESIAAATRAFAELTPTHPAGTLSFWEMFATRALEERVPSLGIEGAEAPLPSAIGNAGGRGAGEVARMGEQVAVRITNVAASGLLASAGLTSGDLLIEVGGEPFFAGRGAVAGLHHWLLRELRDDAAPYKVVAWRAGRRVESTVQLKLGPYADPKRATGSALRTVRRVHNSRWAPHRGPTAPQ